MKKYTEQEIEEAVGDRVEAALNWAVESQWHKVEDRLPEDGQIVAVLTGDSMDISELSFAENFGLATFCKSVDYGEEDGGVMENVFCSDYGDFPDGDVTHWAPLPMIPADLMEKYRATHKQN